MKQTITLSLDAFKELAVRIPEKRRVAYGNFRHRLADVLAITIFSIICGYSSIDDIYLYALAKKKFLVELLNLEHGIPSVYTLERVLNMIEPAMLESVYRDWVMPYIGGCISEHLIIDGKEIRGVEHFNCEVLNNVSIYVSSKGITMGQISVESKSNEIVAIPKLLDAFEIKGGVISIDAIGCQKEIAAQIREKEADYILATKRNQKNMYEDIEEYFKWVLTDKCEKRVIQEGKAKDYGHGRITQWEALVSHEAADFPWAKDWKDIKSVVAIKRRAQTRKGKSEEARYYISNLESEPSQFIKLIREHWLIENSLHWELDTQFNEDACRVHKGNAPENLAKLRKVAMALMSRVKKQGLSYHKIQIMSALDNDYMLSLLHN